MLTVHSTGLAKHTSQALIIAFPGQIPEEELMGLQVRYPGLLDVYKDLQANAEFKTGSIAIVPWGDEKVIFIKPDVEGKNVYIGVRDCLRKIGNSFDQHKCKNFACSPLGVRQQALEMLLEIYLKPVEGVEINLYAHGND